VGKSRIDGSLTVDEHEHARRCPHCRRPGRLREHHRVRIEFPPGSWPLTRTGSPSCAAGRGDPCVAGHQSVQ
jgi:hypothetical protein